MNVRRNLTAVAASIVVATVGIAVPVVASAAPSETAIVDCAGDLVTRPSSIVLTCGDASVSINKITWSSWTANAAKGKGTLAWNTCLPKTCVDGIVEKYPVRIVLGGLASGTEGSVFSKVRLAFPKGGPAALEAGTYTIDNPIG